MIITDRKVSKAMLFLFTITYMVSYITRINYGAVISEMVTSTGMTKSMLSLAVTGSFVTYGAGQIVSGIIGDRFSPKKLISYGLLVTVVMNLLIPLSQNHYQMFAVWCVNGFAQAFMWPPMVKIMTAVFDSETYKEGCVKVSWGSSLGTIVLYLLAPVIISVFSWKMVFVFSAVCGIIMIFVWNKFCIYEENAVAYNKKQTCSSSFLIRPFMFAIMVAIALQGMLRDGVSTWMPSYIAETYDLNNAVSILSGVVLPVFSIIAFNITSKIYRHKITNVIACAGVVFSVGVISAAMLCFFTGRNVLMSVVCSAVLNASMHGVNLLLLCMVPEYFVKYGNVSTVTGVLNACTYTGSAVSTFGIALLTEHFGWDFTLKIWCVIAFLGTIICFSCIKPWNKNMK